MQTFVKKIKKGLKLESGKNKGIFRHEYMCAAVQASRMEFHKSGNKVARGMSLSTLWLMLSNFHLNT